MSQRVQHSIEVRQDIHLVAILVGLVHIEHKNNLNRIINIFDDEDAMVGSWNLCMLGGYSEKIPTVSDRKKGRTDRKDGESLIPPQKRFY